MIGLNILFLTLSLFLFSVDAEDKPKNSSVCYKPFGCFPTDGAWFSLVLRPFPAPDKPEDVGTKIYYFNRGNKEDGLLAYQNLQTNLNGTVFEAGRKNTFFITHGFLASGNSSWMSTMKNTLLNKMDANVFLVDWGKGAEKINYFQAASNTRIAGAELGRFINNLKKDYKLNPSTVHLIGHSLGAHISSYAAKIVKGISRVTGLDAAQPGFEGLPKEVRIDSSDADFVDLIHTNIRPTVPTLGFGMIAAAGDVDIYVNGGLDQPGCYTPDGVNIVNINDLAKIPFKALAKWISCSHGKAYEYFTASLDSNCKIWARTAGKLRSIVNAVTLGNIEPVRAAISKCSADSCTELGLETPQYKARGVFAATTIRQYPYCDESEPEYDKNVKEEIRSNEGRRLGVSTILKPLTSL